MATKIRKILSGKKTNLTLAAAGILGICYEMGWISDHVAMLIGSGLLPLFGISVRSAYGKGK